MPEEVRALTITGGAADDYRKLRGVTRRRGRRPAATPPTFSQEGGDNPPGQSIASPTNYNAARRLSANMKIFKGGAAESIGASLPLNGGELARHKVPMPSRLGQGSPLRGGGAETLPGSNPPNPANLAAMPAVAANLKAGLMPPTQEVKPIPITQTQTSPTAPSAPRPQTGGKITLAPAKKKRTTAVLLAPPAKKQHRKGVHQTRKIRMQLAGLKTRLTRAKIIHKESRDKSIADVRKLLEEAKLVKPAKEGKQVPESVLRDIYKDYLLLRNKAL